MSSTCFKCRLQTIRVSIVSYYDRTIRSPSFSMKLPSVIALKSFIRPQSNPNFTRFNVFLRDKFSCQYCGSSNELTFDHLLPRSKGGKTDWDNVVTACSSCNVKKGRRLLKYSNMNLEKIPMKPTSEQLQINGRNLITWDEKFKLDVWYVDNQSFWLDIKIILLTFFKVVKQEGISQNSHVTMQRFKGNEFEQR